jgi:hypothetical protein
VLGKIDPMTTTQADIESATAAISPLVSHAQWQAVRDAIGLAREQGRREMQEQCAKLLEESELLAEVGPALAAAIRALK